MGRRSIFGSKEDGYRVQGVLTKEGGRRFEQARRALAKLVAEVTGRTPVGISDADAIEALARGEDETRRYLRRRP